MHCSGSACCSKMVAKIAMGNPWTHTCMTIFWQLRNAHRGHCDQCIHRGRGDMTACSEANALAQPCKDNGLMHVGHMCRLWKARQHERLWGSKKHSRCNLYTRQNVMSSIEGLAEQHGICARGIQQARNKRVSVAEEKRCLTWSVCLRPSAAGGFVSSAARHSPLISRRSRRPEAENWHRFMLVQVLKSRQPESRRPAAHL